MELGSFIKKNKINAINNLEIDCFSTQIIYLKKKYANITVQNYILKMTDCNESRMLSSLKLVNLSPNNISKNMQKLSLSELLKVELAVALIKNKEELIFYEIDKYFIKKDLVFFKRLFKKLVEKYNKTIVLINSDFSFLFDFVEQIAIVTDQNIVKVFNKDEFYGDEIYEYIKMPQIVEFIKYVNKDKKRLDNYSDITELIKAIYREV